MIHLESFIDHTLLGAQTTREMIEKLCMDARDYGFKAVCINPFWIKHASAILADNDTAVASVVGFPLGATFTSTKAEETRMALSEGALEIDMVMNIGAFLSGDVAATAADIEAVRKAAGDAILKVIIEISLLDDAALIQACELSVECGADFVKTSTGFSESGATEEAVRLMRKTVGPDIGVKASGGIRTKEQPLPMIEAGASRIGTSSGVAICRH